MLASRVSAVVVVIAACGVPQNNLRIQNKVGRSPHACPWVSHKNVFRIRRGYKCFANKSQRN